MHTRDDPPPVTRRSFWRQLLGGVLSVREESRGIPQQSLGDIGRLPDSVLEEMIPVWREGWPLEIRTDGIYPRGKGDETVPMHTFAEHEKAMVDQFACGRNLRVITDQVARRAGLERDVAYGTAKALFVRFCELGWCHPAAGHFQESGAEQ